MEASAQAVTSCVPVGECSGFDNQLRAVVKVQSELVGDAAPQEGPLAQGDDACRHGLELSDLDVA